MKVLYKLLIFKVFVLGVAICQLPAVAWAGGLRPVHARHAIVVSVHEEGSKAGVSVMQRGGNAVDAAVPTGFALAGVHPAAGNLGGGAYLLGPSTHAPAHFFH